MPLPTIETSGLRIISHEVAMAAVPPAVAAKAVSTAMTGTAMSACSCEPGLKPNQPMNSRSTPAMARGMLWPGRARGLPSSVYLPMRGPSTMAPARAANPPVMWTRPEPAKSMKPASSSHPAPHFQLTTIG